jgi:hypothetical protein
LARAVAMMVSKRLALHIETVRTDLVKVLARNG